jgi:hypothetical protein
MGVWGYRSFDDDIVLDWVEEYDKNVELALEKLYEIAEKDKIQDIAKNLDMAHVLVGIISYAIYESIKVPKNYLKDGIKSAEFLLSQDVYLQNYARPTDRKASLKKEMYIMQTLIRNL